MNDTPVIFELYRDSQDAEALSLIEGQIKLAALTALAQLRSAQSKAPIFPARIVAELTLRLDQGGETQTLAVPSLSRRPSGGNPAPQEPPAPTVPPVVSRQQSPGAHPTITPSGNFVFWFGKFKGRSLFSFKSRSDAAYLRFIANCAWLPNPYKKAIFNYLLRFK